MKTSEAINELAAALAKAQAIMGNAAKDKENPFFKSKYADLASIRDVVTPPLSVNGLSVTQGTSIGENCIIIHTRLLHSSGQWIESQYPILNDTNKPQAMGSAMTYGRRYSLSAICNLATEEDDDGNAANDHGKKAPEVRNGIGTLGASKRDHRPDFERLVTELRRATTVEAMKEWAALRKAEIAKLPDDWTEHMHEAYSEHKASITAKAA